MIPDDDAVLSARARSSATDAVPTVEVGRLLAWLARAHEVRTAVEIGSAAGVSGLHLLQGLDDRGVLTSLEPDAHRHGLATQAYAEAGVSTRVRAIEGDPATVLPRLADGAYDLVLVQHGDDDEVLAHARRLVRPGGLVVLRGATDATAEALADDEALDTLTLPLDTTLVLARHTP